MLITTAQRRLEKPELRFYTGSNPAGRVLEFRDREDLWHWSLLEIKLNSLSLVKHTVLTIHHYHRHPLQFLYLLNH